MPGTNRFLPDCGGQFKNPSMVLPDCRTVDYTDCEEIAGYGHLLLSLLQRTLEYNCTSTPSISAAPIIQASKEWLRLVEKNIISLSAKDTIKALSYYDILHRLVYRTPSSESFLNDSYMRVFNARINGDFEISDSQLYQVVSDRLRFRDNVYFDKLLRWHVLTLSAWYKEILHCGKFFNVSHLESLGRVTQILSSDLFAFCGAGEERFKQRLVEEYLPGIKDLVSLCGKTLCGLLMLVRKARGKYIGLDEGNEYDARIMSLLIDAPDITLYDRQAFRLDIEFKKSNGIC